ncbi:MAG: superoxide dismutase [Cyclobacteriaceae bacterium]|nr:superoxide dismutase [Cyclobacteriaceae bacterium]
MKKTNRREFVQTAVRATVITTVGVPFIACASKPNTETEETEKNTLPILKFSQIKLPYEYAALEPSIDAQTMDIHYNKHHAAYVKNVNEAIEAEKITFNTELEFFSNTSKLSAKARNNGGGVWNHNFFWQVMKPGGGTPSGKLANAINGSFESFEKFKEQFTTAAMTRFGSGWAWLVNDNGKLKIGSTPNQDNPLMDISDFKGTPLLALDVWEHAYYLKYQNKRNEYVANWWNVVNWDEVASRLS